MASDLESIEAALQTYFDGLHEGDTEKLGRVFHECAHLYGSSNGKVTDMPRAQWFENVRKRPSAKSQDLPRHDWVVSIDRAGPDTAFAKVHCAIPPRFYTDYLSLARLDEGWRVVSKTFHVDTR